MDNETLFSRIKCMFSNENFIHFQKCNLLESQANPIFLPSNIPKVLDELNQQPTCNFGSATNEPNSLNDIIDVNILNELKNFSNWNIRAKGIEKLINFLENKTNLKKLMNYLDEFFELLNTLIKDKNFKISTSSLKILSILNSKNISIRTNIS